MGEIFTVADIRRNGWREDYEEQKAREFEKRGRELDAERERKARATRKAEEKQQRAVASNSEAWDAWFDQRLEQHFFSNDRGVGGALKTAIGEALGRKCAQVRDEFKRADEAMQRAFEAKLAELRERFLASNSQTAWVAWVDDRIKATFGYGRDVLLGEVKDVIEEAQRSFEMKFEGQEERCKAGLPIKFPIAKAYRSDSVHYSGDVVTHAGATYQATCDTCREPPHDDWVRIACAGRDAPVLNICGTFNAYQK